MKRREHLALLAASGLGGAALAQGSAPFTPQNDVHYRRLPTPLPRPADGRIEVLEFFWYGCPHCFALEPALQAWKQKLPPQVSLKPVAIPIHGHSVAHQRLFFTLQAMGVEGRFRMAIFDAIHKQHQDLPNPAEMLKLLQPLGLDAAQFSKTWAAYEPKSFSGAQIAAANRQAEELGIESVPTLVIGGLYLTSPSMAGRGVSSQEAITRAVLTLEHLIKNFGKV